MQRTIVIFLLLLGVSIGIVGPIVATKSYRWSGGAGRYSASESVATFGRVGAEAALFATGLDGVVFVGGQNGTWFQEGQFPRLSQLSLVDGSSVQLDPVRSEGTVWGGGYNGSQLLVSGWGSDDGSPGPYIWLYDGAEVVTEGSLDEYGNASSWSGGDVFAASYNGNEWLLSGLGSGVLPIYSDDVSNHMSLGTFNGSVFTDLSSLVPEQQDAILYANGWNGQYWLVGGGLLYNGVLFTFDGKNVDDFTPRAESALASFGSVQSIAWNGSYWLIGGVGFLAEFDGSTFIDLTQQLKRQLATNDFFSVNAIVWNGKSWMLGGGAPIGQVTTGQAWIASYNSTSFVDLTSALPSYISNNSNNTQTSSILSITASNGMWVLGGYSGGFSSDQGLLLAYHEGFITDYSDLVRRFTYVDWVSSLQNISF